MRLELILAHTFQENLVPEKTKLVGWAALVQAMSLKAPVHKPSCVSDKHVRGSQREEGIWRVFDKRYWPGDNVTCTGGEVPVPPVILLLWGLHHAYWLAKEVA
jgi:hypothetical protein